MNIYIIRLPSYRREEISGGVFTCREKSINRFHYLVETMFFRSNILHLDTFHYRISHLLESIGEIFCRNRNSSLFYYFFFFLFKIGRNFDRLCADIIWQNFVLPQSNIFRFVRQLAATIAWNLWQNFPRRGKRSLMISIRDSLLITGEHAVISLRSSGVAAVSKSFVQRRFSAEFKPR